MTLNLNLQRSMIFFIIYINGEGVILPSPLPKEEVATAKPPVQEPGLCQVLQSLGDEESPE